MEVACHGPPLQQVSSCQNLHAMTDRENKLILPDKLIDDVSNTRNMPQQFRSPTTKQDNCFIVLNQDIIKSNICYQAIAWTLNIGIPPGSKSCITRCRR